MMNADTREIVTAVLCDVAEKIAFMFGEPEEAARLPQTSASYFQASMRFSGDKIGEAAIIVPEEMVGVLAANVLGLDNGDEVDRGAALDALKELLNVTCGHILTSLAGSEPLFDLGVPEISQIDGAAWQALKSDPNIVALMVDEFPVMVRFIIDEASA